VDISYGVVTESGMLIELQFTRRGW